MVEWCKICTKALWYQNMRYNSEEHPFRVFFFIFHQKFIVRTFTHSLCYNEITEENPYFNQACCFIFHIIDSFLKGKADGRKNPSVFSFLL
jgi:hypothetical protein